MLWTENVYKAKSAQVSTASIWWLLSIILKAVKFWLSSNASKYSVDETEPYWKQNDSCYVNKSAVCPCVVETWNSVNEFEAGLRLAM